MTDISVNCTPWWSSNEQQVCQSFAKNLSLQMGASPPHIPPDAVELTRRPRNQDSSLSPSTGYSNKDDHGAGGVNSQDSDSDESLKKVGEGQMTPHAFMGNPSFGMPYFQVDKTAPMIPAPYGCADPYVNGLYTAYGPNATQQMIKIAPARVPLPLDLSEDCPIYVNAKQYNGILRRRQIRAKLEAQNKLVKRRKPYLHESRHKHALNRIRGSGGRFLPTTKTQQSKPARFSSSKMGEHGGPMTSCHVISSNMIFSPPDHTMPDKWEIRGNEGFLSNRASIVR